MNENPSVVILLLIIVGFVELILLVRFAVWLDDFKYEHKYLKMEIKRSEGKAKSYYRRKLFRLWLSILPFVKYNRGG